MTDTSERTRAVLGAWMSYAVRVADDAGMPCSVTTEDFTSIEVTAFGASADVKVMWHLPEPAEEDSAFFVVGALGDPDIALREAYTSLDALREALEICLGRSLAGGAAGVDDASVEWARGGRG